MLQKLLIKLKFNDRFSFSSKFDYFGFGPFRLTFEHQSSICRPPFSTSFTSEGTPWRQYTCQMSIAPAIKGNLNTLRQRMVCIFFLFKKKGPNFTKTKGRSFTCIIRTYSWKLGTQPDHTSYCSSQLSLVHWLSSSIFPFLVGWSFVTSDQISTFFNMYRHKSLVLTQFY